MQKYQNNIAARNGDAVVGIKVLIKLAGTATPATIYSDDGVTTTPNPLTTNANGYFEFYVANGLYDIAVSGVNAYTDVLIADALGIDADALKKAEAAAIDGATKVGTTEGTVQVALDGRLKTLQNYTSLLAYSGTIPIQITTLGIAGPFRYNSALPNVSDGGTRFAHASGTGAWERIFDKVVRLSWFQAKGDWNGTTGTDDTVAVQAAVDACKNLSVTEVPADAGPLTGLPLHVENTGLAYLCTDSVLIDRPINIVGDSQGRALNSQTSARFFFQDCDGFTFTENAYLFDIRNIRLDGTKQGGIDPEASDPSLRTFGNSALVFHDQLSRGKFENCLFSGFDIGKRGTSPTPLASPPGWAGAYKYFNYCGFLNCTYSVCNLDHVTDETYFQTYARCDSTVDGYFLVQAPLGTVAYCTINLIGCMAEGICKKVDPTTPYLDFASRGFRFKGRVDVVISGGYYELNTWFVDTGATLTSNAWLAPRYSDLFGGGGLVDLSGSFANSKQIVFPDFSNAYWLKTNLTRTGFAFVGDNYAEQFTVGAGGSTSMQSNDLTVDRQAAMAALPNAYRELFILCEVEWHANAGTTLALTVTVRNADGTTSSPSPATYASPTYYSGAAGWKRIFYTLPLPPLIGGKKLVSFSPSITVTGAANTDVVSIRQCRFSVLAR